ncbi:hypothetical protein FE257_012336 [Aspergillus nanangensis]|uniref:Uncharacterized protein n=1 Tax=Aspergillus nanangensis TaxID=2582783 RepID=A0AAD4CG47_ASPNN|nr:hypothetical protein FE257_012336 [Aspergillus nanangensis]
MTTSYFSTITSESSFKARFKQEHGKVFADITRLNASYWGREHLFACRLIRRKTPHSVLPVISKYTKSSDLSSPPPPQITNFLNGPPDQKYMSQSEHQLVRNPAYGISLGQVWSALANVKRNPPGHGDKEGPNRPKRLRQSTLGKDDIDSSTIKTGTSSPEEGSSPATSSVGYVDPESHRLQASPEDETLRLASCVMRHVLYFGAPQDSMDLQRAVEFRDTK